MQIVRKKDDIAFSDLFGYALSDVYVGAEAAHAQVGGVGVDGHAALAAQA